MEADWYRGARAELARSVPIGSFRVVLTDILLAADFDDDEVHAAREESPAQLGPSSPDLVPEFFHCGHRFSARRRIARDRGSGGGLELFGTGVIELSLLRIVADFFFLHHIRANRLRW